MSSFCTAKATHIFFSKKFQHICLSLDVNFNESLTNDIVSFEQLGPGVSVLSGLFISLFFFSIDFHFLQTMTKNDKNWCTFVS